MGTGDLTGMVRSIPLALTVFRICSAPILIVLAALELERAFLGLAVAALLSDALDGAIARRLGAASQTGRLLESWSDLLIALTAFVGAALLWPDTMREEAAYIAVVLTAFVVPNSYALLRFRRLLGYHTISAKVSGVLLSTGAVLLFLGVTPLLFRVAALVELMVALEYIAISLIIPDWDGEIPSVWHALRLRNAGQQKGRTPRDA